MTTAVGSGHMPDTVGLKSSSNQQSSIARVRLATRDTEGGRRQLWSYGRRCGIFVLDRRLTRRLATLSEGVPRCKNGKSRGR